MPRALSILVNPVGTSGFIKIAMRRCWPSISLPSLVVGQVSNGNKSSFMGEYRHDHARCGPAEVVQGQVLFLQAVSRQGAADATQHGAYSRIMNEQPKFVR
jgi:hypothetical protein